MAIIFGSARHDENGKYLNGKAGDQLQKTKDDYAGEVSMQNMYSHKSGWYVLRPDSDVTADKIAERMRAACNNPNIGYDQNQRLGIISNGIDTKVKTECDCSTLVRACVQEAAGIILTNFTTANEKSVLERCGIFQKAFTYINQTKTPVYNGDVLVTKVKGHTGIIVNGNPRNKNYYPACNDSYKSIVDALRSVGETDISFINRTKIAKVNNIIVYSGTASENLALLNLLKAGKLRKA